MDGLFQAIWVSNSSFGVAYRGQRFRIQGNSIAAIVFEAQEVSAGAHLTGRSFRNVVDFARVNREYTGGGIQHSSGPLKAGGTGYFVFRANHNAQDYYGWMRIKVTVDATDHFPTSISFAANGDGIFGAYLSTNDPGFSAFTVGAAVVPEPSTAVLSGLALLALGNTGVRELRRRKRMA